VITATRAAWGAALLAAGTCVSAQGLTGDWGGARTRWAQQGVALRGDLTVMSQGLVSGSGSKRWDETSHYDLFADLDFGKMGWAQGLGFHVHAEGRLNKGRTAFGGQL
jgi:porin